MDHGHVRMAHHLLLLCLPGLPVVPAVSPVHNLHSLAAQEHACGRAQQDPGDDTGSRRRSCHCSLEEDPGLHAGVGTVRCSHVLQLGLLHAPDPAPLLYGAGARVQHAAVRLLVFHALPLHVHRLHPRRDAGRLDHLPGPPLQDEGQEDMDGDFPHGPGLLPRPLRLCLLLARRHLLHDLCPGLLGAEQRGLQRQLPGDLCWTLGHSDIARQHFGDGAWDGVACLDRRHHGRARMLDRACEQLPAGLSDCLLDRLHGVHLRCCVLCYFRNVGACAQVLRCRSERRERREDG
mmetsp:Transcript_45841/g.143818  ORF Transcript_45841/g.143818 Transcript_45841/m.143818 type:complete len:291 (+) Transcript_45841:643-1515(+)